ncbi:MAG: hypothetical protein AAB922_02950 [Patescibacteria group bacterium]
MKKKKETKVEELERRIKELENRSLPPSIGTPIYPCPFPHYPQPVQPSTPWNPMTPSYYVTC